MARHVPAWGRRHWTRGVAWISWELAELLTRVRIASGPPTGLWPTLSSLSEGSIQRGHAPAVPGAGGALVGRRASDPPIAPWVGQWTSASTPAARMDAPLRRRGTALMRLLGLPAPPWLRLHPKYFLWPPWEAINRALACRALMPDRRMIEAYCSPCQDVRTHVVRPNDPGSCMCTVCGQVQPLVAPLA